MRLFSAQTQYCIYWSTFIVTQENTGQIWLTWTWSSRLWTHLLFPSLQHSTLEMYLSPHHRRTCCVMQIHITHHEFCCLVHFGDFISCFLRCIGWLMSCRCRHCSVSLSSLLINIMQQVHKQNKQSTERSRSCFFINCFIWKCSGVNNKTAGDVPLFSFCRLTFLPLSLCRK